MIEPMPQSAGGRRESRRRVRNALGTTRDGAPGVGQVLRAVEAMVPLVTAATGGRFRLQLIDTHGMRGGQDEPVSSGEARYRVMEENR